MGLDLSPLFTPFNIGSVTLPNRFVMPSMQRGFAIGGVPTADMARYYRRRVEGGVSLVMCEGTAINHPTSTDYTDYALLIPAAIEGWKHVVAEVKKVDGHVFLQLWHQGAMRQEGKGMNPEAPTLSPSGLVIAGESNGRAMTTSEMSEIIEAYVDGARVAKSLGFDGIEIHAAHGYMLDQFLWAGTNQRTDEYGGTLENRARFPCEVVRAIRSAVGENFPISFRVSQWKTRDFDAVNAETPEEFEKLLKLFVDAGVDIFHVSSRRFWTAAFEGSELSLAGWASKLTNKPVITVGSVGLSNDLMASLGGESAKAATTQDLDKLANRFNAGEFDLVAVGRAVLGDAQWVNKVRDGRLDALRSFTASDLDYLE